ncbi:unnamed protein product [Lupinus luteus]|uniref:Gibberellin-regulated protein 14 n=1 Tax=Lupinus luteus TaxID=3873 RepID=A0AAV1X7X0_LUPLU
MASKSFLLHLLLIFLLLVATKISSYDEDLKIEVNYAKPLVAVPPVKPPPPPSPVVKVATPPPVKAPPTNPSPPPPSPPVKAQPPVAPAPLVKSNKECIPLCGYRCKLHSRKQVCLRACVTCCERCKCVPPGTYGNRDKCGKCYTDMLTHGNRPKCP